MCAAAIAFIGIGEVRYVADDPSDHHPATGIVATRAGVLYVALNDPVWWTVANLLFLYSAAEREGSAAANIAANIQRYPSLVDLALSPSRSAGARRPSAARMVARRCPHSVVARDHRRL